MALDVKCTTEFLYIIGYSYSFSLSQDIAVLKYNSSYSLVWNRTYGTSESNIGYGIMGDDADNVVLTGKTTLSNDTNVIDMKLNGDGIHLWNTSVSITQLSFLFNN